MQFDGKQLVLMVIVGFSIIGISYYAGIETGKRISVNKGLPSEKQKITTEEKKKLSDTGGEMELTFYEELTKPEIVEEEPMRKIVSNSLSSKEHRKEKKAMKDEKASPAKKEESEKVKKVEEAKKEENKEMVVPPFERKTYTVQVGSFQSRRDAISLINRLKKKGYPAYLLSAKVGSRVWYRVRVGEYSDRERAVRMLKKLETNERLKGFVTLMER